MEITLVIAAVLLLGVLAYVVGTVTGGYDTWGDRWRALYVAAMPGGLLSTTIITEGFAFSALGVLILL